MVKPSNSASNESSDGTLQNVLMNTYSICSSSKEMAAIGKYAAEHKVAVADRFYQNFCKGGALGSKRMVFVPGKTNTQKNSWKNYKGGKRKNKKVNM